MPICFCFSFPPPHFYFFAVTFKLLRFTPVLHNCQSETLSPSPWCDRTFFLEIHLIPFSFRLTSRRLYMILTSSSEDPCVLLFQATHFAPFFVLPIWTCLSLFLAHFQISFRKCCELVCVQRICTNTIHTIVASDSGRSGLVTLLYPSFAFGWFCFYLHERWPICFCPSTLIPCDAPPTIDNFPLMLL